MSNSKYKEPDAREKVEGAINNFQNSFTDNIGNLIDETLQEKRNQEDFGYEEPLLDTTPKDSENGLKSFFGLILGIILLPISWLFSVQLLYWLFPMPHSSRRLIAIVPAFIITYFLMNIADSMFSKFKR